MKIIDILEPYISGEQHRLRRVGYIFSTYWYRLPDGSWPERPRVELRPLGAGGHRVGRAVYLTSTSAPKCAEDLGLVREIPWFDARFPIWVRDEKGRMILKSESVVVGCTKW